MENGKMTNGMAKAFAHSMTKYRTTENGKMTKDRSGTRLLEKGAMEPLTANLDINSASLDIFGRG
jgi:hypothetical protein